MILDNGAVLLGESFVCDSHANRPIRMITHAHVDHILELNESFQRCKLVAMTPATKEIIEVLYRFPFPRFTEKIQLLNYKEPFEYLNEKVTLFNAGHIAGSAQVLVENSIGTRMVYTGDFKLPEAEIIECDVLIMEATYGNVNCIRPFKEEVEGELARLIQRSLKSGPVYIFGYHGKLQEAVEILRRNGITLPVIMPERVYQVAKICERYGMKLGEYFAVTSDEAMEAMKNEYFIGIYHASSWRKIGNHATKIYLSGWEFQKPVRKVGDREYEIALSDHSDFDQLLEYVERSSPKLVITDNYRIGDAVALAREIRKRLKIPARAMPRK
ncbi:MAG: MBL fold metallo-hydrolase [Methanocellales archaeon]